MFLQAKNCAQNIVENDGDLIYMTKKTLELGKHTIYGKEGVSQISEKKKVSVGTNSTFRHPFAWQVTLRLWLCSGR